MTPHELSELRDDLKAARRCCASMRRQIRRLKHKQVDKPLACNGCIHFDEEYISDVCIDCYRLNRNDYYQRKTEGRKRDENPCSL